MAKDKDLNELKDYTFDIQDVTAGVKKDLMQPH